ncbi:rCG25124, partial [Rattus norvegicus]
RLRDGLENLPYTEHQIGTETRKSVPRPPLFPHWGRGLPPPEALLSPAPSLRVSEPATSPPPLRARGGWVPRRSAAERSQHWERRRALWAANGAPVGFPQWLCYRAARASLSTSRARGV